LRRNEDILEINKDGRKVHYKAKINGLKKESKMETTNIIQVKPFHWRTLVAMAALLNLAVLLFMGLVQRDNLAITLAAITLAGFALSRFRSGLPGVLLLGLLFTDISIWTVSGAVNNFMHREQGWALLLPSFLGVISLTGLVASAGAVINRRKAHEGSRTAMMVGSASLGLLLLAAAASLLTSIPESRDVQAAEVSLGSKNMEYSSHALLSSSGEITVNLANEDLWWHTFTIDELGVDLNVPMGVSRSVTFSAPPGEYRFYCAIPGHEAIGMHGVLTVEK
jgi:plastocyanin